MPNSLASQTVLIIIQERQEQNISFLAKDNENVKEDTNKKIKYKG